MPAAEQSRPILAFYFLGLVREIIPIYPLYAIMFGDHGVSPLELSMLFIIWAATGIALEVPSGALADRFSRKWLIVLSGVLKSLGFLTWYLWQDFPGYALGFVLWGTGSTFRSGSLEALLNDLLTQWDRKLEFTRHYGRIGALGTVGVAVGEFAGAILIVNGYDIVLLVSMAVPLIATMPFILYVDEPTKQESVGQRDYLHVLKDGVMEALGNRAILYILLTYTFLLITFGIYDEYVPPTLREKGFSPQMVAFLCVPILIAQSAGHWLAHYFDRLSLAQLLGLLAISAATLSLVIAFEGFVVAALMAGFFFMFGLSSTLFQGHLQSEIEGASRATVTSVVSFDDGVGAVVWFFIFGAMAEASSMTGAAFGLSISVILLCALFHWLARRWSIVRR